MAMNYERPKHRFFAADLAVGDVTLAPAEAHHALHVLRLPIGAAVEVFDGRGGHARGIIHNVGRGRVTVGVDAVGEPLPQPGPAVHVASALPKGKRQDWMLQKLTELGVRSFRPLVCRRSVATLRDHRGTLERWRAVCIDAARQSGQRHIPVLYPPAPVSELPARPGGGAWLLAYGEGQEILSVATVAATWAKEPIDVWVGPEGGWGDSELADAVAAGAIPARLGHTTLRIETAAIAMVAAVIACAAESP